MIFMRGLLTTIIVQCRVKALNTELAIACLYKAVMRFKNAPKCTLLVFSEIHNTMIFMGPLKRVTAQKKALG